MKRREYANVIEESAIFNVYDVEDENRVRVFTAYPQLERVLYEHYRDIAYNEDKLMCEFFYREFTYSNVRKSISITMKLKVEFADAFEAAHEMIEETLYFQYMTDNDVERDSNLIIETDRCCGDHVIACYDPVTCDLISKITK